MFPRRFGNREAPSFRKLKLSSVDRAPLGALLAWRGARQGAPSGGATVTRARTETRSRTAAIVHSKAPAAVFGKRASAVILRRRGSFPQEYRDI